MEVFRIFGSIFLQGGQQVAQELKNIDTQGRTTTSRLNDMSDGAITLGGNIVALGNTFGQFARHMTLRVTAPLALLGGKLFGLSGAAEETQNLFSVSMGEMTEDAERWVQQTGWALALNETELRKALGTYHLMFTNMGMGEEAAYDMGKSLTQLAYDMASFYNLRPEEAFEKLSSGMVGMSRPLRDIGIIVDEAAVKTWAYTNGLAAQGAELTLQQKLIARYNLILEQTDKAQGDLERTWFSAENQLRRLKSETKTTAEVYGDVLKPIIVTVIGAVTNFVMWLRDLSDEHKDLIIKIGLVAAALGPLAMVIQYVMYVVGTLTTAVGLLGKAIMFLTTNPLGMVIAAIGALIAIGVALYRNWDEVKEWAGQTWDAIKNTIKGAVDGILGWVTGLINKVKSAVEWVGKLLGLNRQAQDTMPVSPDTTAAPAEMAEGGRVARAGWSWVGEQGPELMKLPKGAEVWPLPRLAAASGGTPITVNVNNPVLFDQRMVNELGSMLVDQIRLRTGLNTV